MLGTYPAGTPYRLLPKPSLINPLLVMYMSTKSFTLMFLKLSNCCPLIVPSSAFFLSNDWERAPCQLPPWKDSSSVAFPPYFLVETSILLFSSSIKTRPSDLCLRKSIPTAWAPFEAFMASIFWVVVTTLSVISNVFSSSLARLSCSIDKSLFNQYLASLPV